MKALFIVIVGLSIVIPCAAGTIYVDCGAGGANDGSSWADAFVELQSGLDVAVAGDEIWVAEGIYKPTHNYGLSDGDPNRLKHFRMKNGVGICGGFPDTGSAVWEDRDPNTYVTILSGDLLGNDNPAMPVEDLLSDPTRADNCYHVLGWADPITVLDGFTITGGNANGSWPHEAGGGMYNFQSSPTVTNCRFSRNSATIYGGGMTNGGGSPTVTNCTFTGNRANGYGGGMWNMESNTTVSNCTFSGNSALWGGGMSNHENWDNSLTVTNCIFSGNSADRDGGGICNMTSNPMVSNCTFSGNSADNNGGGMWNEFSSPAVTDCMFSDNSADKGGGIYNWDESNPIVTCIGSA